MKKLGAFFIVLIALVAIAGCNRFKKTDYSFDSNQNKSSSTTITKLEESDKNREEVTMEIPDSTNSEVSINQDSSTDGPRKILEKNSNLAATGSPNLLLSAVVSILLSLTLQKRRFA